MRLGQLPPLEYAERRAEPSDQWGPNLEKQQLLSESPTLARAVAQASSVINSAGDAQDFNRDELKQLEAPLKMSNGKPLRASVAMDLWSLGLIAFELFTNEPFFAGCSEDVALQVTSTDGHGWPLTATRCHHGGPRIAIPCHQVLASSAPLELPMARIADTQAQHLLAKILLKRPKDRASIEVILRHAYLVGGLDTQQVGGSFAMLHESQNAFKSELGKLQAGLGPAAGEGSFSGGPSFGGGSFSRASSMKRSGQPSKSAHFS